MWAKYKNGNYDVIINLETGSKIRHNNLDYLEADFPESFDFKITNYCEGVNGKLCEFCHENSSPNGKHGDIMNMKFIENLHPYTEIAVGGGSPLTHPDLIPFLEKCKELKLIPSMTINQYDFLSNHLLLKQLCDDKLIYGLGVSLDNNSYIGIFSERLFVEYAKEFPNMVVHVINGLVPIEKLKWLSNFSDHKLKVLILGYKEFRRGAKLYETKSDEIEIKKKELYDALPDIINNRWFDVVSFDNLAIEQLDPSRVLTQDEYERFFMGVDGFASMYVDGVEEKFAKSSTAVERYDLMDDIKDMFEVVRTR